MPAWDPFAVALLEGGLKPMPLARIDAVKAAVRDLPEATAAARAALEGRFGPPTAGLDEAGAAEVVRAASRGWSSLDDELKTEIKRVAKLLGAEEDADERRALADEFGRLLGGGLLGVAAVTDQVGSLAQVTLSPPEPGQPAYAETLLDVAVPSAASSRRAATPAASDEPFVTLRGALLSCAALGVIAAVFSAAGLFGYQALGFGDRPLETEVPPSVHYELRDLTPPNGLATRARALDVTGRVHPAGPAVVRVQGIRRRVGKDGRFSLTQLGLEEGLNRIAVVVEERDGTELARADLGVNVDSLAPTLEIVSPASQAVVLAGKVEVALRIADASPQVELQIGDRTHQVHPGLVKQTVELPTVGPNRLVFRAVDVSGNASAPLALDLIRAPPTPGWFQDLPVDRRPPIPLPVGVAFGEAAGAYRNVKDGSVLVWIPPGEFSFGSLRGDRDERPVRQTEVSRGFFMGKYEVTRAQYLEFCKQTSRKPPPRKITYRTTSFTPTPDHPVVFVTWADAKAYCVWAGLRLPTEVEWEYAAKGPEQRVYPWGDDPPRNTFCNRGSGRFDDMRHAGDGFAFTAPVGSFPKGASPFGCLDMAGNAMEWVADWYSGPGVDPNRWKVIRGGSWRHSPRDCRSSNRSYHDHDQRPIDQCGFRVAK